MKELIDFIPILLFPNRLKEKEAENICYTNGFIWRGDSSRIVMVKTPFENKGSYEYHWKEFQITEPIGKIECNENGCLRISTSSQQKLIKPIEKVNDHRKIKAFRLPSYQAEVSIDSKKLTRSLLMMKTDLDKHRVTEQSSIMKMNTRDKQISLYGINSNFSLNIEVQKDEAEEIHYSYPLMSDLLLNARGVSDRITIKACQPYYSLIQYHQKCWAVMTHKRSL